MYIIYTLMEKLRIIGLTLAIIGIIMFVFSVINIITIVLTYNFPRPQHLIISEILNLYAGEPLSRFGQIVYLGLAGFCGIVIAYYGFILLFKLYKFISEY